MNTGADIDIASLVWVQGEIDQTLARALEAFERFAEKPDDNAELRFARTHLHQAHGALTMVGLDGLTQFAETLEAVLDEFESGKIAVSHEALEAVHGAFPALRRYLDELVGGARDQPLKLLPIYVKLQALRGETGVGPADLFYPDLSRQPAGLGPAAELGAAELSNVLRTVRMRFERGFLAWLRSADGKAGLSDMREAIAPLERIPSPPGARAFWWSVRGLIDALAGGHLAADLAVKRLWGRIGTQLRRFVLGSRTVAERLVRDVLYCVAMAPAATAHLRAIRSAYRLDELVPRTVSVADITPLKPVLHGLRETIANAKDAWNRFCAGSAVGLPQFAELAQAIASRIHGLPQPELERLTASVLETAQWLRRDPLKHSESIGMEVATALLLVENAIETFERLDPDFPRQAEVMSDRLEGLQYGEALPPMEQPLLGEMSRRAQEKLFMSQVTREILNNLTVIEQTLDGYFRDPQRRDELTQLAKPLKEVEGALSILAQDSAAALLDDASARIGRFIDAEQPPAQSEFEDVAHKLSALGFFVERLQHGPADLDAILHPERKAAAAGAPTVEEELKKHRQEAQALIEALRARPGDPGLRRELRARLETIREAASLVDDAALEKQAKEALAALATAPAREAAARVQKAAADILPAPVSAPPVPPPVEAPPTTKEEIDAELLEIFIEEAGEVLESVGEQLERSRAEPHNQEVLTTIRRGFHTLKGSGRMVGLAGLGEAAWAIEQVMNRWLQLERDATPELHGLIAEARELLVAWVEQLGAGGGIHRDASALAARCEALRSSLEPPAQIEVQPPAAGLVVESLEEEEQAEARIPETAAPSDEDRIRIGELVLSRKIHGMYLAEARGHLGKLRHELARLHLNPAVLPSAQTIRAAHTLAGVSATMGVTVVHDLARALEQAMRRLARAGLPATADQSGLLNEAATTLESMVVAVSERRMPAPAGELADRLAEAFPEALALELEVEGETGETVPGVELEMAAVPIGEEAPVVPAPEVEPVELAAEAAVSAGAPAVPVAAAVPEEAAPAGQPAPERRVHVQDDIDPSLLPIFLEEADDLTREIAAELRGWREAPADGAIAAALKRLFHTLKGSSRMAGAMVLGEHVHAIETRIEEAVEAGPVRAEFLDELDAAMDRCAGLLDRLRGVPEAAIPEPVQDQVISPLAAAVAAGTLPEPETAQLLRVRADMVDKFVNEAGEISIARSRIDGEMRQLRGSLLDLTENIIRLRAQMRELEIQAETQIRARARESEVRHEEFDPLEMDRYTRLQELARMIAESVNDVTTVQHHMLRNLDHAESALSAQGRLNRELQQSLMTVRMVPFDSLADRLHRIVRQSAKELGKRASLDIRGGHLELDRGVLDRMVGPLEHLLRNAISHGIESGEDRGATGKPPIGSITLSVAQSGNELAIELADDGRGLDFERIRRRGVDAGLLGPDSRPDRAVLADMIFRPGFSTAAEVSAIAGRGVGMDVVRDTVQSLGGRLEVRSEPGKGTAIRVDLPMTLAVMQALLVRLGGKTFAIPTSLIEQVMELKTEPLERIRAAGEVEWLGIRYPYRYLPRLLGDSETLPPHSRYNWLLLVRAGAQRAAVQVDSLRGNQEVVVKKTAPQLARIVGITGATVLGDGEIVLIVNPVVLHSQAIERGEPVAPIVRAVERVDATPTVMVVDDSLTVRKITGRLLEREGYRVVTAKDGVEALEKMLDFVPDVMVVDIEMPRMDGYDLTRNVRSNARLKDVPIIMITSRTADKHRSYAEELGVNHYLGKPYPEDELLRLVSGYAGISASEPA